MNTATDELLKLSQQQRERLAYIEFRLFFLGEIGRGDLIKRFGVAPAAATRDFATYRELFPRNINFDATSKSYIISEGFVPAFDHVPERVLTALTQGFGEGINSILGSLISCEIPIALNRIKNDVLAPITRAIYLKKPVRLNYSSHTSGASQREIVPFAIATDGLRWHARAFDRKNQDFRDFVISRMSDAVVLQEQIEKHESESSDIQWNRIVELNLVPHPDRKNAQITIKDFEMNNGELRLRIRAAMAGYLLRQWHVDCSPKHEIEDAAFRLWLKNPLALYDVSSARFAPGYITPD